MSKEINTKLDAIDAKLDEHTKILANVDKTLALQAQQLETHIKRTELAEENIDMLRNEFKPIEKHVHFVNTLAKLVIAMASIAAAVYGIWEIFHK